MLTLGRTLLLVWSFPFFLLVDTRNVALLIVAVVVLNVGLGASYGPQPVGAVLGGGFAPLIATALQSSTGTSLSVSVSVYMLVVAVVSLVAVFAMKETLGRDVRRQESHRVEADQLWAPTP